ncbi:MAG: endo-1,4-beta-xylanase [Planctomycetota bacterium]
MWSSKRWLPTKIEKIMDNPAAVDAAIDAHFADVLTAIAPLDLDAVDLVNEPRVNHEVMDLLGKDVMAKWWTRADALNPGPQYYLNDYGILNGGGSNSNAVAIYKQWLETIAQGGGKVEGIGFQGHFGNALTPPEQLWKILDEFAGYGVPLQVTEFDVDTTDEQAQADYTRDFYTAMFAHEAVDGVFMWGFWEQIHWRPNGAMFRKDWSPKPNLKAYRDLVLGEWWTDETTQTNETGAATVRGFLGEYRIVVETENAIAVQSVTLVQNGSTVTVRLASSERAAGSCSRFMLEVGHIACRLPACPGLLNMWCRTAVAG